MKRKALLHLSTSSGSGRSIGDIDWPCTKDTIESLEKALTGHFGEEMTILGISWLEPEPPEGEA